MSKPINCAWVIDDDPLQVLILNRLLSTHSAVQTTKFFSGAKSAIDALGNGKIKPDELPDLIFLDLIMQRGDGWDFLEHYRKIKGKLTRLAKIIVVSSSNEENEKKIGQYADVIDFLPKPISKDEFELTMDNLLAKNPEK